MAMDVNKDRRIGLGLGQVLVLYSYFFILINTNKFAVSYGGP